MNPQSISFEDSVNEFRSDLICSVQRRVFDARNITSDFSGGLDSTTLAIIAAQSQRNHSRHITALTLDSVADHEVEDVTIAKEIDEQTKKIKHVLIDNRSIPLPYSYSKAID